ncbi:unnamed protein product [Alopecurus aequalis]
MTTTLDQEASPHPRVLETAMVAPSPAPETTSIPLTFLDVVWLNFSPVGRVFFYRLSPDTDIAAILSNLKDSLSRALGAFYPLAGRLRPTPGMSGRHELHYLPGDGVSFSVAELDAEVEELAADEPREVARILPLVPPLSSTEGAVQVLAVQATVLRGGRGLAVGVAVHHAACDGASSTRFLHTWAVAANGARAPPPSPPVFDRTLVKDPTGLYDMVSEVVSAARPKNGFVKMTDDKLLATFTLSKEDIQGVKDVVASVSDGQAPPPRCSSLVATFSFIWSCYQRAKDDESSDGSGQTYFVLPIDQRSRIKPYPISDEYFGNCIVATMAAPNDQLAAAGADGLLAACMAVTLAIERGALGELGLPEKMMMWMGYAREVAASGGGLLAVGGSPRFQVYDVDFGFGRPAKVELVARSGYMTVAESRGSGGGIEVGMFLPPASMRRFQNCFHARCHYVASSARQVVPGHKGQMKATIKVDYD